MRTVKQQLAILVHRPAFWLATEVLDELPGLKKDFINSLVPVVERVYPNDEGLRPQTIAHHFKRYWFATTVRTPKGRALDYACGSGYGTEILREAGYDATGIDINGEAVTYAKSHFPKCTFTQPNGKYNLITFFEAIEHMTCSEGLGVLFKFACNISSGGTLVMSLPRDKNEKRNGFHKSHWNVDNLTSQLELMFRSVQVVGQDWDTGEIGAVDPDFYILICKGRVS